MSIKPLDRIILEPSNLCLCCRWPREKQLHSLFLNYTVLLFLSYN